MRFDRRDRGFTIIEMLIGMTVMAILIGLAAPNFSEMLRNWAVRGAAESLTAGLQLARAEAIKRNADVRFALVSSDPTAITGTTAPTRSDTGPSWAIYIVEGTNHTLVDSRPDNGNSVAYASTTPGPTGTAGQIIFDSMGRARELTGNASFDISGKTGGCQHDATPGKVRCLRTVVTPAGSVRMCDPKVDASDSRACPAA